jgi:filamentous hemagglutinin family protein
MRTIVLGILLTTIATPAIAQSIIPDNTLGAESSIVQPRNGFEAITGGATRATGLFHSFSQFDVNTPTGAYFLVRPEIQNIFARVTGNQGSTINGSIGTKIDNAELAPSTASLFLLNPNGIIFGPNAKLDLGGSFLATTASGFQFAGDQKFSALNPQAAPLLTVSVPIGLQFGQNVGGIEVNGAKLLPATAAKSLSLIGGNVKITDATLSTISGQLDVGAVGANDYVELVPLNLGLRADYSQVKAFQDITIDQSGLFSGATKVEKFPVFPIDLQIRGGRVALSNNSNLRYAYEGVETPNLRSGKIKLTATESVNLDNTNIFTSSDGTIPTPGVEINTGTLKLSNASTILLRQNGEMAGNIDIKASQGVLLQDGVKDISQILSGNYSQGDTFGGAVNITTPTLELYGGSTIFTLLATKGKAGDINLNVDRLIVSGERENSSTIVSGSSSNSIGDTGNINILAGSVDLMDGGSIIISRFGQGQPGTIDMQVKGAIVLNGSTNYGIGSFIGHVQRRQVSKVNTALPGVNIRAGRLLLDNGGKIETTVLDDGDALDITIQVDEDVTIRGSVPRSQATFDDGTLIFPASAILTSKFGGIGNGGNIQIRAKIVQLLDGGRIQSDIAQASSQAPSEIFQGRAGDIVIVADDRVTVAGQSKQSLSRTVDLFPSSSISSSVGSNTNAQGGNIFIQSGTVQVLAGGEISSDMLSRGQAGAVEINVVGDVTIAGAGKDSQASAITSSTSSESQGNAGAVTLRSQNLNISDGGLISTATRGSGRAGAINITTSADVTLQGKSPEENVSNISSSSRTFTPEELATQNRISQALRNSPFRTPSEQLGDSGTIRIAARNLRMNDRSLIFATSGGSGAAGDIDIRLRDRAILNDAEIRTSSTRTSGGNIDLSAPAILLRNDANIKASIQFGNGAGGNIRLNAGGIVLLEDSDILAFAPEGRGGNITLNTQALLTRIYKPSEPTADLLTLDINGFVDINATGVTSGIITLPSLNPLQNNRPELPQGLIDPSNQLSRSCLARNPSTGKFYITGAGGIPSQPGDPTLSNYSTLPVASTATEPTQIVEADGFYPLDNGKFILGKACQADVPARS